jgi:hypothetical protein
MSFSGKATYTAGSTLPEIVEDVSDLVSIASPHETPLLDALGDPAHSARSTIHEWLEDALLPNTDAVASVESSTAWTVLHASRFRVGDLLRVDGSAEVIAVTAVDEGDSTLTVTRSYGGSTGGTVSAGDTLHILGNAALEGSDADAARFTARSRKSNYTQIFSATVEVSGSELATKQLGVKDELDYHSSGSFPSSFFLMICVVWALRLGSNWARNSPVVRVQSLPLRRQKKRTSTPSRRKRARKLSTSDSIEALTI